MPLGRIQRRKLITCQSPSPIRWRTPAAAAAALASAATRHLHSQTIKPDRSLQLRGLSWGRCLIVQPCTLVVSHHDVSHHIVTERTISYLGSISACLGASPGYARGGLVACVGGQLIDALSCVATYICRQHIGQKVLYIVEPQGVHGVSNSAA
jgi:hypothetical protein